jgi:hypothetical protein
MAYDVNGRENGAPCKSMNMGCTIETARVTRSQGKHTPYAHMPSRSCNWEVPITKRQSESVHSDAVPPRIRGRRASPSALTAAAAGNSVCVGGGNSRLGLVGSDGTCRGSG